MNTRASRVPQSPVKNQEMAITYKGKVYAICEQGQLDYLVQCERERWIMMAYDEDKTMTESELNAKIKIFLENCGYSTLNGLLARMTPEERKNWQDNYRFSPIKRTA